MMKVPASMRSGMMRWRRREVCVTPVTLIVEVPAPSIFAPMLLSRVGEVGDFGLAGAVLHDGFAFGESGGHQQIFGAGDGDFVEDDFGAAQAVGAGFDVAVLLRDLRAQLLETFDVQIDGARADGASAGQGNAGASAARDQRAEYQGGRAHGLD